MSHDLTLQKVSSVSPKAFVSSLTPYPSFARKQLTPPQDAITYAAQAIRINAICPGYVNTPLLQEATASGAMDSEIAKTPMGRMAHVDEIADSIVFLASPMASFMTGASLVVDGGYTVN
jgi:hypothetical protein